MEPSKKDFSPEQLKDLLWEIEQAPRPKNTISSVTTDPDLVHSLGEELEEVAVFGEDISSPEQVSSHSLPVNDPSMEDWLHEIATQKISEIIQQQNLEGHINQILQQVIPPLAEALITREIEKIKEQIRDI